MPSKVTLQFSTISWKLSQFPTCGHSFLGWWLLVNDLWGNSVPAALPPQSACFYRSRRRFAAAVDVLCYVLHFLWRAAAKHRLHGCGYFFHSWNLYHTLIFKHLTKSWKTIYRYILKILSKRLCESIVRVGVSAHAMRVVRSDRFLFPALFCSIGASGANFCGERRTSSRDRLTDRQTYRKETM